MNGKFNTPTTGWSGIFGLLLSSRKFPDLVRVYYARAIALHGLLLFVVYED
jgi:hypothetical protein